MYCDCLEAFRHASDPIGVCDCVSAACRPFFPCFMMSRRQRPMDDARGQAPWANQQPPRATASRSTHRGQSEPHNGRSDSEGMAQGQVHGRLIRRASGDGGEVEVRVIAANEREACSLPTPPPPPPPSLRDLPAVTKPAGPTAGGPAVPARPMIALGPTLPRRQCRRAPRPPPPSHPRYRRLMMPIPTPNRVDPDVTACALLCPQRCWRRVQPR